MIRGSEDGTGSRRPLLGDAGIVTPPDSQRKDRCRNAAVFFCVEKVGLPFVQPLSLASQTRPGCGTQHPQRFACVLLAAAPTAPPCFRHWRRSSPLPLVGEPLAKPFTLRGLPKPPLGRGGGSASALTERLSPAAAHGQACKLSVQCLTFGDNGI